jgi:tRNA(Ile)-lysidine synthase
VAARCVAVAYSGGRDSTALLHATLAEAAAQGVRVLALHVHHGLSPRADAWLAHGEAQCRRWARAGKPVVFVAHRLTSAPASGDSVEAWAREARYEALREMARAHGATVVLLAHHQRDQAETLLLQALRGAGTAGLAGMPRSVVRDGIEWQRPWLDKPREAIDAYVRRHRLKHIEDDSNADPRFARNRLRLQVWPALATAFPQAEVTLATAAQWAQQATIALDELADIDLANIAPGEGLQVAPWLELTEARRSNVLRAWIKRARRGEAAPASLIARLLDELPARRSARWPLGDDELRVYRGVLRCDSLKPVAAVARESTLAILRPGAYPLPGWAGELQVEEVADAGVPLAWLAHAVLRERAGAERFQSGTGRPPRSLKKQFQEAAVPAWQRGGPLVYSSGQLVFVPGLGLDARVLGLPGQRLVTLRWVPRAR